MEELLPNLSCLSLSSENKWRSDEHDEDDHDDHETIRQVFCAQDAALIIAALGDVQYDGLLLNADASDATGAPGDASGSVVRFEDQVTNLRRFFPEENGQPRTIYPATNATRNPLYKGTGRYHQDVLDAALQGAWNPSVPSRAPVMVTGEDNQPAQREAILGETVKARNILTGVHESATEVTIMSTVKGAQRRSLLGENVVLDAGFYGEAFLPDFFAWRATLVNTDGASVARDELPPLYQWSGNYNEDLKGSYDSLKDLNTKKRIVFFGRADIDSSFRCYGLARVVRVEYRPAKAHYDAIVRAYTTARRVVSTHAILKEMASKTEAAMKDNTREGYKQLNKELRLNKPIQIFVDAEKQLAFLNGKIKAIERNNGLVEAMEASSDAAKANVKETKRRFDANELRTPFLTFRLESTTLRVMRQEARMGRMVAEGTPSAAEDMRAYFAGQS